MLSMKHIKDRIKYKIGNNVTIGKHYVILQTTEY